MDLLVAGIVCTLLFVATYSQRRAWIALGSAMLSAALVAGLVFIIPTAKDLTPVRDGLTGLSKALPAGWDRRALNAATALDRASKSVASARREAAEPEPAPILATSVSWIADWFSWNSWFFAEPETEQSPAPDAEPAVAKYAEPAATPRATDAAIQWLLDAPPPHASDAFTLQGANVSDQPLKVVRAVLKPESGAPTLKLTLYVEGASTDKVVPPRARFSLRAEGLAAAAAAQFGGAILSVAYIQAERRKSSIMYLTQARLVERIALD